MKNIGVILAGGSGTRLGGDLPKQLTKIAGRKVIEHTVEVFEKHPLIDEICIVVHPDCMRDVEEIVLVNGFRKVKKILLGGRERYFSSLAAINAYTENVNLIFHDSVRPLVNQRIITDCVKALDSYGAVDTAVPTTDTIIQVNEEREIVFVPDRSKLRNGQTPQAFRRDVIARAYELALQDPEFKTTDDCSVVLKYLPEERIYVVNGETFNIKLTYKEDAFLLDKLFQLKSVQLLDGNEEFDISRLFKDKCVVIFGGNSGIGSEMASMLRKHGVTCHAFSRSNGVHVDNAEEVRKALREAYEASGRIDFVVNCAGVLHKEPLAPMDDIRIAESIDTNLLGSIIVARESFEYLKESRGGLLFFTSSSYTRGRAFYTVYSATKAAVVNLTQGLSEEWHGDGIRVNCINPARTDTPLRRKNFGVEPPESLLKADRVALVSLKVLTTSMTGEVIDIKL